MVMNPLNKNIYLTEFFFFLALGIYLGVNIISFSFLFEFTGNTIYKYGILFSIFLLIIKEFLCNEKLLYRFFFTSIILILGFKIIFRFITF